jgi:hypothetical protein
MKAGLMHAVMALKPIQAVHNAAKAEVLHALMVIAVSVRILAVAVHHAVHVVLFKEYFLIE